MRYFGSSFLAILAGGKELDVKSEAIQIVFPPLYGGSCQLFCLSDKGLVLYAINPAC